MRAATRERMISIMAKGWPGVRIWTLWLPKTSILRDAAYGK
jgi:hypothetical protein